LPVSYKIKMPIATTIQVVRVVMPCLTADSYQRIDGFFETSA